MMRLAINGRFLAQSTTGVQRVAREFTVALDRLLVAGRWPGVEARLLLPPGVDAAPLGLTAVRAAAVGRLRAHQWEQVSLPRALGDGEVLLNLGNTAPVACLLSRRRTAVMIHDLSHRLFPDAYRAGYRVPHLLIDRLVLQRADPIITVAEAERARLAAIAPGVAPHIIVAPNGGWSDDASAPSLAPFLAARVDRDGERPYGLYVGSLSRRKNVDGVIAAAVRLARDRGLAFRIVGAASPILSAITTAIPADVAPLISFLGQVEDSERLRALYRDAALLLFPSFYEASPLPPIEAMAQGCPVVAADIRPLVERCGDAALYCDPADIDSIVAAATRVLDDPALAADLARRGLARAARFSWRAQVETVMAALGAPD